MESSILLATARSQQENKMKSVDTVEDRDRMIPAWTTVPAYVQQSVKAHAKYNLASLSDYWRGWIMDGYRRDFEEEE